MRQMPADSSRRRNALFFDMLKALVNRLGRCFPAQRFARSAIERCGNGREHIGAMCAQIGTFRKVLAQQPFGILVGAALPRALWVAEVDLPLAAFQHALPIDRRQHPLLQEPGGTRWMSAVEQPRREAR
jgi:hypothetical protein